MTVLEFFPPNALLYYSALFVSSSAKDISRRGEKIWHSQKLLS
jgi:hypothetical protein